MKNVSLAVAFTLLALTPIANAQTVTGQITGTVVDSAGAVVAGASVQVVNGITKQVRTFTTSANGSFIFPDLVPADYDLRVTHPGLRHISRTASRSARWKKWMSIT